MKRLEHQQSRDLEGILGAVNSQRRQAITPLENKNKNKNKNRDLGDEPKNGQGCVSQKVPVPSRHRVG